MPFHSILFENAADRPAEETLAAPDFFADLNLDQIVDAATAGTAKDDLRWFFLAPLGSVEAIRYRQEIMRDLEAPQIREHIDGFAEGMATMRDRLTRSSAIHHLPQKQRWFLDAVDAYCGAVAELGRRLSGAEPSSRGLAAFRDHLSDYLGSDRFTELRAATESLKAELSAIRYCLLIRDNRIQVRQYDGEPDYSADVLAAFASFEGGGGAAESNGASVSGELNQLEARILEAVARLHPDAFSSLDRYFATRGDYLDETIERFEREIGFYLAWLDHAATFQRAGLAFCYPEVSGRDKAVSVEAGFDLALADRILRDGGRVVCNDFDLRDPERILVVTGPNQGGKTTFARAFGQLHYLARLGLSVPARKADVFLFDTIFTHFEKEESAEDPRGKLEDDLLRIHEALARATPDSIVIMNEIFSSTTLDDARFLGTEIIRRISELDALCVCVTFVDELASANAKVASFAAEVDPDKPAARTFRVRRRPADGLAYALSLARRHRLTYDDLRERFRR